MCIRDRPILDQVGAILAPAVERVKEAFGGIGASVGQLTPCLLYTSDAADERSSVDLGGRRIIKKKQYETMRRGAVQ